jgi:DNA primase small subunit
MSEPRGKNEGTTGPEDDHAGLKKEGKRQTRDPSVERTLRFLAHEFRQYYSSTRIPSPPRLSRREFAFTFFGKNFMMRHTGFRQRTELARFLAHRNPSSVYYSTAYYRKPGAGTMGEKDWLGADLIFDLDADHIEGAEDLSFEDMLARVKQEFRKLIYDYLLTDFGFREKEIDVVFSGGRGYHIHIYREDVLGLTSHERREIVDYITGKGIDKERFLTKKAIGVTNEGSRFSKGIYTYRLPSAEEAGWRGKITRGVVDVARSFTDRDDAMRRLMAIKGVGKKTAESVVSELFDSPTGKEKFEELQQGNVDVFSSDRILNAFVTLALEEAAINLGGETDEPVTADIKRLIRLPGSLHGKTGFRVVPLTLGELDQFDPLTDAVVLPDALKKMRIVKDIDGRVGEEHFSFREGEEVEVPTYLAVFLAGRRSAVVV